MSYGKSQIKEKEETMKKRIRLLGFVFGVCLICGAVVAQAEVIENETVRIQTQQKDGGITLVFQTRTPDGKWRTVLSNVAKSKYRPYESTMITTIEDIEIAPSGHGRAWCRPTSRLPEPYRHHRPRQTRTGR